MKSLDYLLDASTSAEIPPDTNLLRAVKIQAEPQQVEIMEFQIWVPKRALYSHLKEFQNTRFAPALHTQIEWVGLNREKVIFVATKSWLLKDLKAIRAQINNKEDLTTLAKIM